MPPRTFATARAAFRELEVAYERSGARVIAEELADHHLALGDQALKMGGVAPIPARATDTDSDAHGVPEIQAQALDAVALSGALHHHGALLVRNLFSRADISKLEDLARRPEPAVPYRNLGCSAQVLVELLAIYRRCNLLECVRDYLGAEPLLFGERIKLRRHLAAKDRYAAVKWHQDINFFGEVSRALNCWAAVTSCGDTNPGLELIPRRFDHRVGWESSDIAPLDYGRSLTTEYLQRLSGGLKACAPVLQPGDALLFDEMTLHQTAVRKWRQEDQVVAISWFFRPDEFPAWGTPVYA